MFKRTRGNSLDERTTFAGKYYQLTNAPLAPKPVQSPLPLLIGGGGEQKTLRIAATYADEWNVWGTPSLLKHKMEVLDRHCAEIGRDPSTIKRSAPPHARAKKRPLPSMTSASASAWVERASDQTSPPPPPRRANAFSTTAA